MISRKPLGNFVRSIRVLASDLLPCEIDVLVVVGSEVGIFSITGPPDFDSANISHVKGTSRYNVNLI